MLREEAEAELRAIREEDELRDLEHYEEWQRDQALAVQREHAARHESLVGEGEDAEGLGGSSAAEATDRSTIQKPLRGRLRVQVRALCVLATPARVSPGGTAHGVKQRLS
eukprot:7715517-Pyramimonas_sp.AAC.2